MNYKILTQVFTGDGNTPMLQAMLAAKKKNSDMVGTSEYEDTRRVDQIYCEMIRKAGIIFLYNNLPGAIY